MKMFPPLLLLEVALQAERLVALVQQFGVYGPMRVVATHTSLAHRLVLEYKRAPLFGMALEAGLVLAIPLVAPPPLSIEPLCGSWQSEQLTSPSSTGW